MRWILAIFLLLSADMKAQDVLHFDKRFVESEDRWVAFQKGKDSSYAFGFIYIDAQAGLTFNLEGKFTISPMGLFIAKKDTIHVKYRLRPNNVLVAFIPETKFGELRIDAVPDWLKFYQTDTNSVGRLYRWGFLYNGWNECAKALTYLERAEKKDPQFKGLAVELAFSYNCLEQYEKAAAVLENALKNDPTNAYVNKELIYSQTKSGELDKAAQSCKRAIAECKDSSYNWENCYNLLHSYYLKKDRSNFRLWLDETKKWCSNNEKVMNSIKAMEKEMVD
jgi:tetratricopeptide (TPR) repeat protein